MDDRPLTPTPPQQDASASASYGVRVRGPLNGGELMERPRATFNPPALDRMLPVVLQHWKLLLACTLLGLMAAIAALPLMDTRYLVSAKVLVQLGREMTAPPTATAKDAASQIMTTKRPEDLGSEIEIMRSPQLIEEVVRAFGPDYFLADPPAVTLWQQAKQTVRHTIRFFRESLNKGLILLGVRRPMDPIERVVVALRSAMSMEDVHKSDVIAILLQTTSPDMGVEVLRKYLDLFQEKHIAAYRSPGNRQFFEAEASRSLQQLHDTEAALARFKDEHRVWSITEQSSLLLKTQRDLIDQHARTQRETVEMQNRIGELRRQEASLPPDVRLSRVVVHDPVNDEMRKLRAQIEAQMANSAVVFGDASPQMIQLRRQLETVNSGIAGRQASRSDQETTGVNQQLYEVRREIAASDAQLAVLQVRAATEETQLADVETNVREIQSTETKLYDMQREIGRLDREYQLYTSKLEDSRISDAMDIAKISNVRVISAPTADPIPVFPPLLIMLAGGIAVGLGGALAFVFFRDTVRPVVRSRHDIERLLGLPVLAALPEHRTLH